MSWRTATSRVVMAAVVVGLVYLLYTYGVPTWLTALSIDIPVWIMTILMMILAVLAGAFTVFFLLPLFPGAIDVLTNKPNRLRPDDQDNADENNRGTSPDYPKSEFGFFTYLQPGRVKMIERGNRFIRGLMRLEGHMFIGERPDNDFTRRDEGYWEVVPVRDTSGRRPKKYPESHPIPFPAKNWKGLYFFLWLPFSPLSILWWIWKRWVYFITGAVFTGVYPFQRVRTYPLEHYKKVTLESGEVRLVRIVDWSDHYRVADFQFPLIVPEADTQDKLPVRALLNLIARVCNPYLTAYNTDDDWGARTIASGSHAVTSYTRPRPLDGVLSATLEKVEEFANFVTDHAGKAVRAFGLVIKSTQVLDISPSDPAVGRRLGDLAIARVDRQAREERAKGEAAPVRETGRALRDFPEAQIIPQVEGLVRAAGAVSPEAIVMLGGHTLDPGQAAIVKELRRRRRPSSSPDPDTEE